ncbi:MAG: amidohydrolase [Lewinellaceae bacterium]|nr:amidohydrolase [Phaeodactylibacter sp.]MCB0614716.1 amidohydrolase [Phaeodactylibacter sp.]MCB9346101.1 amidohydrolase [Lewinellaceae bacterium]
MSKLKAQLSINRLTSIRRYLHQNPELPECEFGTAQYIATQLSELGPSRLLEGLGGTGIIAVFDSGKEGPTVLFRSELDALPIQEVNDFEYRSDKDNVSHKCGHDGHMAALLGFAGIVSRTPPHSGRVMLLFQPAEEIGAGAERVLEDSRFEQLFPIDYAFAFHNLPGFPLGEVLVRPGPFTAAVKSLIIKLEGKASHAGEPENGINPALAIAHILQTTQKMSVPDTQAEEFALLTPIHVNMGSLAYGVSAGYGEVHLTLRTWSENTMRQLSARLLQYLSGLALSHGLCLETEWTNVFRTNSNNEEAVDIIQQAAEDCGLPVSLREQPFKWGEDFGAFTQRFRGAMFGMGAGEHCPALHNPDYDFPDELLEPAVRMYQRIMEIILE